MTLQRLMPPFMATLLLTPLLLLALAKYRPEPIITLRAPREILMLSDIPLQLSIRSWQQTRLERLTVNVAFPDEQQRDLTLDLTPEEAGLALKGSLLSLPRLRTYRLSLPLERLSQGGELNHLSQRGSGERELTGGSLRVRLDIRLSYLEPAFGFSPATEVTTEAVETLEISLP